MSKPCEYCGVDLPLGVDKKTRRMRSFHFTSCKNRPQTQPPLPDIEAQRDTLLEKIKGVLAAERSEGGGCGGFIYKPPTREHQRRVAQAWQELHAAIKAVEEGK